LAENGIKEDLIVWIIDKEQWPRAFLRAELIERGINAVGYVAITHALIELQHPQKANPSLIVLELRNQVLKKYALDTFKNSHIPIIILGGFVELNNKLIKDYEWAMIIKRPCTIGTIANAVENFLKNTL